MLKEPLDFGLLKTDFHSHLIPGIDDGAKSMVDALGLIRQFSELGFRKLITTPHIQDEFYKNTPEIILAGLDQVKTAVKETGIGIEIEAAAEYLLDDGFAQKLKNKELLTFSGKYILVELSYFSPHPNLLSFIFELQIEGYKVILAHPERYSYWFNEMKKFVELKNRGVMFQLNTVSLSGHYGKDVKKLAEKFIDLGLYEFVGSDMHNQHYMDSFSKARYEKSMKKLMDSGKLKNNQL
ncbi:MAG: capsular biosynthesis protein [Bacteroidales bacterium]|nr:capsular biosynthesis protein [Bacteroidales bacterium]